MNSGATVFLGVKIPASQAQAIRDRAAREDRSISSTVRRLLAAALSGDAGEHKQ
jgi:plasmid stability protein